MPVGAQAGLARGGVQALDHVAPGGDEHDARARALGRVDDARATGARAPPASSGIGMWSCAWKRTAAASSLASVERRQVDRAHHDALVGDAEPHALAELVRRGTARAAPRRAPRRRRPRRRAGCRAPAATLAARSTVRPPLTRDLGGRDEARLDVEADDGLAGCA